MAKTAGSNFYVPAYWEMGKKIHQEGITEKLTLRELAEALEEEESLIDRIVKLYRLWPTLLSSLSTGQLGQVSWGHFRFLMTLDDKQERDFYLSETIENNWPRSVLGQKIKNGYYRKQLARSGR